MTELFLVVGGTALVVGGGWLFNRRETRLRRQEAWESLQNDPIWHLDWGPPPKGIDVTHYTAVNGQLIEVGATYCLECKGIVDPITWDCECTDGERRSTLGSSGSPA